MEPVNRRPNYSSALRFNGPTKHVGSRRFSNTVDAINADTQNHGGSIPPNEAGNLFDKPGRRSCIVGRGVHRAPNVLD
jgi:hypothetical protein